MVEVGGEGVAESSAGSCEVVAGEGGGVGGRHDARVGEQRSVGRVGLGREYVDPDAGEVPGVEVGQGGLGVEEGAAGDVDEPSTGAHGSKDGVVDEWRLPGLMTGRDDDGVDVGDAVEEAVGGVDGGEGRDGAAGRMAAYAGDGHVEGSEPAGDLGANSAGADNARRRTGE
jgi:hypothetical protein